MNESVYGIEMQYWEMIREIFSRFPHVEEVVLFGSRAKGTYKKGSDIDVALKGEAVDKDDLSAIGALLEDSCLPWMADVVVYRYLTNKDLKEHIDRIGKVIYRR